LHSFFAILKNKPFKSIAIIVYNQKKLSTFAANLIRGALRAEIIPNEPGQVMLPRDKVQSALQHSWICSKFEIGEIQDLFF
jgi:hypothetical protein